MENDRSYFMRRAAQERSAATQAQDRKVRAVHEDLAERYRELAHSGGVRTPRAAAVD
jgi:hypothetical protein